MQYRYRALQHKKWQYTTLSSAHLSPRKFVTFLYTASQFSTMDTLTRNFYLPDTMMDNWPWPRVLNPHYEAMKLEVEAWRRDFKALGPDAHEANVI
jgi:hypothetical protein